jgi:hypothetical protein
MPELPAKSQIEAKPDPSNSVCERSDCVVENTVLMETLQDNGALSGHFRNLSDEI